MGWVDGWLEDEWVVQVYLATLRIATLRLATHPHALLTFSAVVVGRTPSSAATTAVVAAAPSSPGTVTVTWWVGESVGRWVREVGWQGWRVGMLFIN